MVYLKQFLEEPEVRVYFTNYTKLHHG